jgi:hypothetical protein
VKHAEEDLANEFERNVVKLELGGHDLNGHELTMHLSQEPCPSCLSGLASKAPWSVLKQLSMRHRGLTIHVTWDVKPRIIGDRPPHLIIREGAYVAGSRD